VDTHQAELMRRLERCQEWVTAAEGAMVLGWKRPGDFRRWAVRNGVRSTKKQNGTFLFSKTEIAKLIQSM
jgi:hypothetical protein